MREYCIVVILPVLAFFALAWALDNRGAMRVCQERHSFATCHHNLNK